MPIYVCQCPHQMPAKVWVAESEQAVLDILTGDSDEEFDTALDAARDDMRDAYVTDDPFDLYLWIDGNEAAQATRARTAFYNNTEIKFDIESTATGHFDDGLDDTIYTSLDGQFVWSENDSEWTFNNQPPVEADDLFHALCEANLSVLISQNTEQRDV